MAYLNWSNAAIQISLEAPRDLANPASFENLVRVTFSESNPQPQIGEWLRALKEVSPPEELRIQLPGGWTFFWKHREEDNRFLMAHPETDAWVATFALKREFIQSLTERLDHLSTGEEFRLSEMGRAHRVSNLDVVFEVRTEIPK